MKVLSLFDIKEMALKSGRSVYSTSLLANLINKPKEIANVYLSRLIKKGLAIKLINGKISFSNDEYIIASQLIEPSYISLTSALLFHNLIQQVPNNIECVTTRNSLKFSNLKINYHKLPPSLFYGFKRYKKLNSYILIAEPEKAVIDSLYLNLMSVGDFKEILPKLDKENFKGLISHFNGKGSKKIKELINK